MGKYCLDCKKSIQFRAIRCHSCENKRRHKYGKLNFVGINHPNFKSGKYMKRQNNCIDCGKSIKTVIATRCKSCANSLKSIKHGLCKIDKFCLDCGQKLSDYRHEYCINCYSKGSRNGSYIDGRSYLPYPIDFNKDLKSKIRNRDNYICRNCGISEEEHLIVYGQNLHIHHIDYNKENCNLDNLITVCLSCNTRANYNRDYWKEFYKNKLNEVNIYG